MKKAISRLSWSLRQYVTGLFVVAALLFPASMLAQLAGTGTIQGTVSDSTGAVITNAAVTLTETSTRVARTAKTDGSGLYVFPNIGIGTYSLKVTSAGFEVFDQSNIVLEVGSSIAINVKMTVGSESNTIEVHDTQLALQTEDVAYKQTIDSAEMAEMPLNGRQMTGLLQFSGGITSGGTGGDFTGSKFSYQTIEISIAGGMGNTTLWRLDGGDNSDYMAGGNLPMPFPDAVSQFSVESSSLGAQAGSRAGGMVNVVTKSGTNQYHGDAFEFIRNNFIDAQNFTANQCPAGVSPGPSCGKDTLHQDEYGGTFGGPVRIPKLYNGRDRLFFFAGFQYHRDKSATASSTAFIPTAANILNGDYTYENGVPVTSGAGSPGTGTLVETTAPNPACTNGHATQLLDPVTGNPLPGNIYAPGTLPTWNPQSLALLKYLPYTSTTTYTIPLNSDVGRTDLCGKVFYTVPSQHFYKQFITRVDYTLGTNDHLYGRYFLDSYQSPSYFGGDILVTSSAGNPEERVQTETIGEDHTFTSNLVNSAHVAALRRLLLRGYNTSDINPCKGANGGLGVTMTCATTAGLYFGSSGFSAGGGTNSLAHFNDNTLSIDDDVTWLHGKHQIVFGGEYVRNQLNIVNGFNSNGDLGFGSNYSEYGPYGTQNQSALNGNYCATCSKQLAQLGNGQLDFLEGTMNGFSQSKQQQNALRNTLPGFYIQDTFHATKQLTLVAGLRWDPEYFPVDYFNRGETWNQANFLASVHSSVYPTAPAGLLFYGDTQPNGAAVPRQFTQNHANQWDPNFGFTYDLAGDGKTVLRGGAQYMYDLPNTFTAQRNNQNPPYATSVGQAENTYIPFSSPWSVPTLPANSGPGPTITGTTITSDPFTPANGGFAGTPTATAAIFPANSQYIVPNPNFHSAVYAQWTVSLQHDFSHGWIATLQYIGSKGDHEAWDVPINGSVYIPGISTGTAGPSNCNVSIGGTNYWLGEFAGVSAAVPAAGAPCSTTGNEAQRSTLILENPAQGNLIGNVNSSQMINSTAISTYEGMVLSVNHRMSSTFSLLANYTWSKNLDELDGNGDYSGVSGMNPNNPRLDYGPSSNDFRNVLAVAPLIKSAFHFNNRIEGLIINGWEFSGISKIQTGSVFSVTTGSDDDQIGNPNGDRGTRIAGVPLYARVKFLRSTGAAYRQYLNPAAFQSNLTGSTFYTAWEAAAATSTAPAYAGAGAPVYGNTGRNAFHNPPLINFDGQVSRFWHLYENLSLDTRVEAFNLLNHPSFNGTNGSLNSATFGQIGGTSNGARVFQGAVKITF